LPTYCKKVFVQDFRTFTNSEQMKILNSMV
jgi:hypothetical protein